MYQKGTCGIKLMDSENEKYIHCLSSASNYRGKNANTNGMKRMSQEELDKQLADIKSRLEISIELLQELEDQKRGWNFPLKGKKVIRHSLQMRWKQKEIALWTKKLKFFESRIRMEDAASKFV